MAKRKVKRKVKNVIVIAILVTILIGVNIFFVFKNNGDPKLKKNLFIFEYGSEILLNVDAVIENVDNAKIDLTAIEYEDEMAKIGLYECIVTYELNGEQKSLKFSVEVKDTIAPEFIKFSDEIKVSETKKTIDYKSYFEAEDLSDCEIEFDYSNVKLGEIGEYILIIKAKDNKGNENVKESRVIVGASSSNNSQEGSEFTCESVSEPYYKDGIMVVNKKHPLPCNYAPGENKAAGEAVAKLIAEMKLQGYSLSNTYSGYRSYDTQKKLYNNYVARDGKAKADTYSARPGFSEHQSGLAFDLRVPDNSKLIQAGTPEAKWMAENAHKYGFIIRYQKGKESITGYQAEAWHLRYVGSVETATEIYNLNITLEEYLNVDGGDYK